MSHSLWVTLYVIYNNLFHEYDLLSHDVFYRFLYFFLKIIFIFPIICETKIPIPLGNIIDITLHSFIHALQSTLPFNTNTSRKYY